MVHTPRPAWLMFVLLLFRETARKKVMRGTVIVFLFSAKCQYYNSTDLVSALHLLTGALKKMVKQRLRC